MLRHSSRTLGRMFNAAIVGDSLLTRMTQPLATKHDKLALANHNAEVFEYMLHRHGSGHNCYSAIIGYNECARALCIAALCKLFDMPARQAASIKHVDLLLEALYEKGAQLYANGSNGALMDAKEIMNWSLLQKCATEYQYGSTLPLADFFNAVLQTERRLVEVMSIIANDNQSPLPARDFALWSAMGVDLQNVIRMNVHFNGNKQILVMKHSDTVADLQNKVSGGNPNKPIMRIDGIAAEGVTGLSSIPVSSKVSAHWSTDKCQWSHDDSFSQVRKMQSAEAERAKKRVERTIEATA